MKKKFILSILFASTSCAGWHMSSELAEMAKEEAKQHPLFSACASISGPLQGSGVLVAEDVVATAAHVVLPAVSSSSPQSVGPFLVADTYGLTACLGGSGSPQGAGKVYYNTEADLAFLELLEPVASIKVAKVMPPHVYEEVVSRFDMLSGNNKPRLSGCFQGGLEIEYIGHGYSMVPSVEMKKKDLLSIQKSPEKWGGKIGTARKGKVQVSQHFPDRGSFCGWMSLDKSHSYSSALPGDSGAGAFTTGECPWLLGVTSYIDSHEKPFKERTVLTQFSSLMMKAPGSEEGFWKDFLRVH